MILLIDDRTLFRDGLLLVLEGLNTHIEIFETGNYKPAKRLLDDAQ